MDKKGTRPGLRFVLFQGPHEALSPQRIDSVLVLVEPIAK